MKSYIFIQFENGYVDFWIKSSLKKSKFCKQMENLVERFSILFEEYLEMPDKMNEAIESENYEYAAWLRDNLKPKNGRGKPTVYAVKIPKKMGSISFSEIDNNTEIQRFIQKNKKEIFTPQS